MSLISAPYAPVQSRNRPLEYRAKQGRAFVRVLENGTILTNLSERQLRSAGIPFERKQALKFIDQRRLTIEQAESLGLPAEISLAHANALRDIYRASYTKLAQIYNRRTTSWTEKVVNAMWREESPKEIAERELAKLKGTLDAQRSYSPQQSLFAYIAGVENTREAVQRTSATITDGQHQLISRLRTTGHVAQGVEYATDAILIASGVGTLKVAAQRVGMLTLKAAIRQGGRQALKTTAQNIGIFSAAGTLKGTVAVAKQEIKDEVIGHEKYEGHRPPEEVFKTGFATGFVDGWGGSFAADVMAGGTTLPRTILGSQRLGDVVKAMFANLYIGGLDNGTREAVKDDSTVDDALMGFLVGGMQGALIGGVGAFISGLLRRSPAIKPVFPKSSMKGKQLNNMLGELGDTPQARQVVAAAQRFEPTIEVYDVRRVIIASGEGVSSFKGGEIAVSYFPNDVKRSAATLAEELGHQLQMQRGLLELSPADYPDLPAVLTREVYRNNRMARIVYEFDAKLFTLRAMGKRPSEREIQELFEETKRLYWDD